MQLPPAAAAAASNFKSNHLPQFDVGCAQLFKQLAQHCLRRVQLALQDLLLHKCRDCVGGLQAPEEPPGAC